MEDQSSSLHGGQGAKRKNACTRECSPFPSFITSGSPASGMVQLAFRVCPHHPDSLTPFKLTVKTNHHTYHTGNLFSLQNQLFGRDQKSGLFINSCENQKTEKKKNSQTTNRKESFESSYHFYKIYPTVIFLRTIKRIIYKCIYCSITYKNLKQN